MPIIDSIKKAKERGASDHQIVKEIIRQNPEKGRVFDEALKRGKPPAQILEELIKQKIQLPPIIEKKANLKTEEEKRIEEARKRIEALKQEMERRKKTEKKDKIEEPKKNQEIPKNQEQKPRLEKEFLAKPAERKEPFEKIPPKMPTPAVPPKKEEDFIGPLPQKPNPREKFWVRFLIFILILAILAGIATFCYWYFVLRLKPGPQPGCLTDKDCPQNYLCSPNGMCVEQPSIKECAQNTDCPEQYICGQNGICIKQQIEPSPPPSLFLTEEDRTLSISSSEEARNVLSQAAEEWLEESYIRRIIIKNTVQNKFLGLKDFFEALLIRAPDELYQKLDNNFTLFVSSQTARAEGNRIGFVTKIKDPQGLSDLLKSRESTMEEDFQPFFELIGKKGPAVVSYFREAANVQGYTGPNFRYQTLSREDMSICYLISNEYFVFTSSWKSMETATNRLGIAGKPVELTSELKFGSSGEQVKILQLWLKQDPVIYPEGKVTGKFGELTEKAVIKFQEKYQSEILAPQGFTKGTGVVDYYTRIKLNELYSRSGIIPINPELTTDLRFGDHGDEVKILQSWLAKNSEVYPEGIISGWFGYLTKSAVIRFQEKYTSEILTPSGLARGTGIVDALTRQKLNDLYGK